ncbi:Clotting factor B [Orchesella cincta]|uniref:Clotting factor B n=1 Tax=Orchesella cincta TaxID=48709 RepID=A0A1D2MZ80_ORCCI|nr:Clotting factor B [Orchesella cincta]
MKLSLKAFCIFIAILFSLSSKVGGRHCLQNGTVSKLQNGTEQLEGSNGSALLFSSTTTSSTPPTTTVPFFEDVSSACSCGLAEFGTGKIVGGTNVDDAHLWPWFAVVVRSDRPTVGSHCGASLISSRYLVTAAHCLLPMIHVGLRHFKVKLGYTDLRQNATEGERLDMAIESVTIHPRLRFEQSYPYHNDIGLIKLAYPLTCKYNKRIRPVCLPPSPSDEEEKNHFVDQVAITAGFGRTSINGNQSLTLQQIKIKIISNKECMSHFIQLPFQGPKILRNMLCAWKKGHDSCVGDSGGPLFLKPSNSSKYIQLGVTSFGIGCANEKYPGVYTRLSEYLHWIRTVAVDLSSASPF